MKTIGIFIVLTPIIIGCTACLGHTGAAPALQPDAAIAAPAAAAAPMRNVRELLAPTDDFDPQDVDRTVQHIREDFVRGDVKDKDLFYGSVRGMVEALHDPYSQFFDPDEAKRFKEQMTGEFVGIGMELGSKDGLITVIAPFPGSPAEKAGLKRGDVIIGVDGKSTSGLTVEETVTRIRGEKDTEVKLMVFRKSEKKRLEFTVTRKEIVLETVNAKTIKAGGHEFLLVRISGFHPDTAKKFRTAVAEGIFGGMEGLIIDLRDNPGGSVDSVVNVVCNWAPDGPVVVMEPRRGKSDQIGCRNASGLLKGMKTAVLVNDGSASASEIMAGALQDYGKARVFGEKTYGKGCGQSVVDYPDGSMLKLTTFLWKTPKGRSIDKTGIEPDEKAENTAKDEAAKRDVPLERAKKWLLEK